MDADVEVVAKLREVEVSGAVQGEASGPNRRAAVATPPSPAEAPLPFPVDGPLPATVLMMPDALTLRIRRLTRSPMKAGRRH